MPKPIRTPIRRLYVPAAVYFITAVTQNRHPYLKDAEDIMLFRETMRKVQEIYPFTMRAYVFLPDHFHLLIHLSEDTNISRLLHSLKRNFTINFKSTHHILNPLKIWQPGFWDHVIRDGRDFENHFHYIHYNPIKHGYVTRLADYSHSSFHAYVERGVYDLDWGSSEPPEIRGMDFE